MRIEISTPAGLVFEGESTVVEFLTQTGMSVEIRPGQGHFMSLIQDGKITLMVGNRSLTFLLENASAGLSDGGLTLLAANVTPLM